MKPNRRMRRAALKKVQKKLMQELRDQPQQPLDTTNGAPVTPVQMAQAIILQDYRNAAAFQKLVTEIHDAAVETRRWAPDAGEDRDDLESDIANLAALAFETRQHTIETGLAFIDAADPRQRQVLSDEGVSDEGLVN